MFQSNIKRCKNGSHCNNGIFETTCLSSDRQASIVTASASLESGCRRINSVCTSLRAINWYCALGTPAGPPASGWYRHFTEDGVRVPVPMPVPDMRLQGKDVVLVDPWAVTSEFRKFARIPTKKMYSTQSNALSSHVSADSISVVPIVYPLC